jgi:hypothetical protein
VTFYESNPEVRPIGQEPAEYAEMPDPPPPPAPADGAVDPPPAPGVGELAEEVMATPARAPLTLALGIALLGVGALVLLVVRLVRSRRA